MGSGFRSGSNRAVQEGRKGGQTPKSHRRPSLDRRWTIDGSAENCVRNIVCHLDVLLTEKQKQEINWHDQQSASKAVMRVLGLLNDPAMR
jgi:hypothetical protein